MRRIWAVSGALAAVATTTAFLPSSGAAPAADPAQPAAVTPAHNLQWDDTQATAANGPIGDADPARVCGSADNRFLGELLNGDPFNYTVPFRLGDVVAGNAKPTATQGKNMMASGLVKGDVFGTGDFPFDHPFGSDFNMDVELDAPYAGLSQVGGAPTDAHMHTELSEGQLPHTPDTPAGPATGQTWADSGEAARQNVQDGFFPAHDERVLVMGRWINDCGHPPAQTELHPISFLAWSHTQGDRTVVNTYYSPYREMQLYNPEKSIANKVNNVNRPNNFWTVSFPSGLIQSILRIQNLVPKDPYNDQPQLYSWGLIEANKTSPADWVVCAPTGTSGTDLNVNYDFVARPGVQISATPDPTTGCATITTKLGTNVTPEPAFRECTLPWDWLSKVAGEEAGVSNLDLKAQIKSFVADQYDSRVDPDPIMDCYDPVKGPLVDQSPDGQHVTVDSATQSPFYGRVEVFWTTTTPESTTTSSSSSSTTSSSVTTPDGSITVTPATVPQGGSITVSSTGWRPGSTVTILLDGVVLGTLTADASGGVSGSFTVPGGTTTGGHQVNAQGTGANGNALALSAPITVTALATTASFTATPAPTATPTTTGSLPVTGAQIAGAVAVGGALVLAGGALTGATRRRRTDD